MKIVLNLGAGKVNLQTQTQMFEDWRELKVDIEELEPDIVSDIKTLENIEDNFADAIWASHVVEHMHWHDLPDVFGNMIRVLKPDGFAIIRVPDLSSIADRIKNNLLEPVYHTSSGIPICPIDMIYGYREYIADSDKNSAYAMMHKTGFTVQSMSEILKSLKINAFVRSSGLEVQAVLYKDVQPNLSNMII